MGNWTVAWQQWFWVLVKEMKANFTVASTNTKTSSVGTSTVSSCSSLVVGSFAKSFSCLAIYRLVGLFFLSLETEKNFFQFSEGFNRAGVEPSCVNMFSVFLIIAIVWKSVLENGLFMRIPGKRIRYLHFFT